MEKPVLNAIIRMARPDDVAALHDLIIALAEYERLRHMVVGTPEALAHWLFGPQRVVEAMIAEVDSDPVGFALWYTTYSTFLARPGIHLEDLFVRPSHRGLGLGKGLLVRLAQIATERGCGRLEWNVLDWNTPAIDFYKALGGALMPEWVLVRMLAEEFATLGATS